MNAGTTLAVCVLISVRTPWDPTSVAAPQGSSSLAMAGTVMVSHTQSGQMQLFDMCTLSAVHIL